MNPFARFRLYHWLLAVAFGAAYLTGDDAGLAHVWLGYGLILLLLVRLFLAAVRGRGFPKLLPLAAQWRRPGSALAGKLLTLLLTLGFAVTLGLGVTMVDNRAAIAEGLSTLLPAAQAGDGAGDTAPGLFQDADEVHEWLANATLALVGLHLGWLLLFRRRQAWAMLGGKPTPPTASAGHATGGTPAHGAVPLRVAHIVRETADALSIVFALPPAQRARFAYHAGQFLTLGVPLAAGMQWRCYSLSAAPHEATLRVTVKRVPGGTVSGWLHSRLQVGDTLSVMPPAGRFYAERFDHDLLLIGAGSGITPLFAILNAALHANGAKVKLIYANRDADAVIFADALTTLQRTAPERLSLVLHLDDRDGQLDAATLARHTAGWTHAQAYLCGPAGFMQAAENVLHAQGADPARIHLERFAPPAAASATSTAVTRRLQVALAGAEHQLEVAAGRDLLSQLEDAGLKPPSGCRNGQCGACKCKVEHGQVHLRDNQILSARELEDGWTLACQAEARSEELKIRF